MKKLYKYLLIFLLQLLTCNSYAQNRAIDSLKALVKTAKDDTSKVIFLNSLSKEAYYGNFYDTAYRYSLISKTVSQKINYKKGLSQALSLIANIYFYQGNYYKSLENNLQSLKIREALGDETAIANSYNNIGNVYLRLKLYSEALKSHYKALGIRQKLNDSINIRYSYNNIGNVYQQQQNFSEALKNHFAALKISRKDKRDMALSLNNIGIIYTDMGNYEEALKYHQEALKIAREIHSLENEEINLINSGKAYLKLKKYKIAEEHALKGLSMAKDIGDAESITDGTMLLSILYEQTGDFKKSLDYYHAYISIRDSIYNDENVKNAVQTQLQFEFEKKEMAAKKEQEENDLKAQAESKKQKWILFLVSCILLLTIVFALITYRGYLQKQKANKIILRQKLEVERQRNESAEKNKDITSSITYAQRIQQAILPAYDYIKKEFPESFVMYKPKDIIGGDFYWISDAVTKYEEKFIMIAVADCTGHGVPGALMSIIGNNYLRLCEREPSVNRPSEALNFINVGISRTLRQEYSKNAIQDGMDMVFVAIDYNKMILHFSGAKNSIYIVREHLLAEYKGDRHPIGSYIGQEMKKFTDHPIPVKKGDCVYLFSDGYADQFGGPKGKKFMYERFKAMLTTNSHLPMEEQHQILIKTFDDWKGTNDQVDDVCVIGIKI